MRVRAEMTMGRPRIDQDHANQRAWSKVQEWRQDTAKRYAGAVTLRELMDADYQAPQRRDASSRQ